MIDFRATSDALFVSEMRKFLNERKTGFAHRAGFSDEPVGAGRSKVKAEPLKQLEIRVNTKAKEAESASTTRERVIFALDYIQASLTSMSNQLGCSRGKLEYNLAPEQVKNVFDKKTRYNFFGDISEFLRVPVEWLLIGGADKLPANSHIGIRVGDELAECKEKLYDKTIEFVSDCDAQDEDDMRVLIEREVFNNTEMSDLARKAGGRWQVFNNALHFSPWRPFKLSARKANMWPDEVEEIIESALAKAPTVVVAWREIQERCAKKGYSTEEYPKRVAIYRRVQNRAKLAEQLGVDLSAQVEESFKKKKLRYEFDSYKNSWAFNPK